MTKASAKTVIQTIQGMGLQAGLHAVQYHATVHTLNRRFGRPKPRGRFHTLGDVKSIERRPHSFVIHADNGYVEADFVSAEIVRVRMRHEPDFPPPFSYAVTRIDWPEPLMQTHDEPPVFTASTDQLVCHVQREGCRLSFETPSGQVISADAGGFAWRDSEIRWTRELPKDERCFGLGQRASALNLRGKQVALWNADPLESYESGDDPIYFSIPFYIGVQPELVTGIFWDNPARGCVDLGAANADKMTFGADEGELRFYLFAGPNIQTVLRLYTDLTGRMSLPPMWALGFHQSRWGYDSEATFRTLAHEFRQRQLPCDAFYFDIDYMDDYRVFTWDREHFPLLPNLLADLAEQGFKSVAILDPGIRVDPGYSVYDEGQRDDVFLKYPNDKPVIAPVWPGKSQFPDFTSARVRAWWAAQLSTLTIAGFSGFWTDMNEPAVITFQRGATLPDYVVHDWDSAHHTHMGGGHNVYGMLMARATREGLQKQYSRKRPFVLSRAGYAGSQRYAASWTGDNASTWEHMRLSISMILNAGLSGIAFTGADVGGFAGEPDGELFTRWIQLGSMMPFFRAHSRSGTPAREPWRFGEQYETIIRRYLELRYQMLPYIYSAFAQCTQDGMPVVRPLFMVDPEDENLRDVNDAFMLGDSLLVAPILEPGATQRDVYLPKGVWYEFDTGKLTDGARTFTAQAPLERMPIYVRAGRVIPMWPTIQYVGDTPPDEVRLRVYAGSGETTLYEDAGEGLEYRDGEYRWSYFTCKFLPSGQFAIEWRRAGQYQPPYKQIRVEVVGISGEPESVVMDGQSAPIWYYESGVVELLVQPFGEARIIGRSPSSSKAEQTLPRPPRS
jgi:alpha-glucosidase